VKSDVVLVGGGLANCLIALRLANERPELRLTLVERGFLGGNHLWSFHDSDISAHERALLEPSIVTTWQRQEVRFPELQRHLTTRYNSIPSDRLAANVRQAVLGAGGTILESTNVCEIEPTLVQLEDGSRLEAPLVIDGRGAVDSSSMSLAYQKFVGLEVEVAEPHGVEDPILMDATVEQEDGYRFLYTLPLSPDSLLLEDTRYSNRPDLDQKAIRLQIESYAARHGWKIKSIEREETGVLPILLAGDIEAFWEQATPNLPRSGLRALLFHPTTGYSLPLAAELARLIASTDTLESEYVYRLIRNVSVSHWNRSGYFRLLNRMLFHAAEPEKRFAVLQHFYRLPQPLIERFYAGAPSKLDRLRILTGRPPVPISRALATLPESSGWQQT
jgi:lycopene beta-cyclase